MRETDKEFRLGRRDFFSTIGIVATPFLAGVPILGRAQTQSAESEQPAGAMVAKTRQGQVRGAMEKGVVSFKGIPYGGSPAGKNRFKAPPKPPSWSGVRDALDYGPQAIQAPDPMWPKEWKPARSSEDCLFLNVWTPAVADGRRRPVMFYSHGGGFNTGNGGADPFPQNTSHNGAALAKNYDVVVVTHNHRLNLLGYLYLGDVLGEEYAASGAAGMLDIAAALEWVVDNIENFGGDPDNVMIWGESGGGAKTTVLTVLPKAQGHFQKASIESGSTLRLKTRDEADETTYAVLDKLKLNKSQARELLNVPAERLAAISDELSKMPSRGSAIGMFSRLGFAPVVDGHYIPNQPYEPGKPVPSANIPLIVGTNKEETMFIYRGDPTLFTLDDAGLHTRLEKALGDKTDHVIDVYRRSRPDASPTDLYIAITTAQWMGHNAITLAERKLALHAAPVYMYVFAYQVQAPANPTTTHILGAAHAMEIAFKFDHPETAQGGPNTLQDRIKVANNMSSAWAAFARTSNPSSDLTGKWPAYTIPERATMFIDVECKVVDDPFPLERQAWEESS